MNIKNISKVIAVNSIMIGTFLISYDSLAQTISVQSGDTLSALSQKYNTTIKEIKDTNHLTNDTLYVGMNLVITTKTDKESNLPSKGQSAFYKVAKGDTLYLISKKFGINISEILQANGLTPVSLLYSGQSIKIPALPKESEVQPNKNTLESKPKKTYTVMQGDTIFRIAQNFNTTMQQILKDNIGISPNAIEVGQKITISSNSIVSDKNGGNMTNNDPIFNPPYEGDSNTGKGTVVNPPYEGDSNTGKGTVVNSTDGKDSDSNSNSNTIEYQNYTIQKGDNAWNLSAKFGIPMSEFFQLNELSQSSVLTVGSTVKVAIHHIPVKPTLGSQYGEALDWWTEAQYVWPIGTVAKITDTETGLSWQVKRTTGAFHADVEPLTSDDTAIMKYVWGGDWSWSTRPILVEVNGHRIAASMSAMPHSIETIIDNNFDGHTDIHFLHSKRHSDGLVDAEHQASIQKAIGNIK